MKTKKDRSAGYLWTFEDVPKVAVPQRLRDDTRSFKVGREPRQFFAGRSFDHRQRMGDSPWQLTTASARETEAYGFFCSGRPSILVRLVRRVEVDRYQVALFPWLATGREIDLLNGSEGYNRYGHWQDGFVTLFSEHAPLSAKVVAALGL
jgi:hypothetical protein